MVGEPRAASEREVELPGLERLLGQLIAVEEPLCLAYLGLEGMRRAPIGASGLVPQGRALRASLRSSRAQELGQLLAAQLRLLELGHRRRALGVPCSLVVGPAARPLPQLPRSRIDRRDPVDRAVEELAVVRHEDQSSRIGPEEALQSLEAVEVEVVRRLVEQEHVVAREEDRRQCDTGRLPAGQPVASAFEVDVEAKVGAYGSRSCLEVGTSERQIALERVGVALLCDLATGERSCGVLELTLRAEGAGSTAQRRDDRLPRLDAPLLLEIADRQRLGSATDGAVVGQLHPGQEAEQRRLADTVGTDEPDARARTDSQRDPVENDLRAVALRDVCELHSHRQTSGDRG